MAIARDKLLSDTASTTSWYPDDGQNYKPMPIAQLANNALKNVPSWRDEHLP